MSPRALDHLVMPCADLAAAARRYEELGFQVGRRNRHPWGTENHIVQFAGAFLELIALSPDYVPLAPGADAFPIAGFLAGQGLSRAPSGMIVLRSADAAADAAQYRAMGIGAGRTLDFSRDGLAPDGTTRTVAFSLAFAEAPTMPDVGFFTCRQHHPENFWDEAKQRHPNGARGIAAVVIAAAEPSTCETFLSRFCETAARHDEGSTLAFALDGATLWVRRDHGAPRLDAIHFTVAPHSTPIEISLPVPSSAS